MKIIKSRRHLYTGFLLLIVLIFCIPFAAQAKISIHDTWATSGRLTLEGTNWTAVFCKEEGALLVYPPLPLQGGDSKSKETMKIVPFLSEKAQTIISCKVIEDKEDLTGIMASFSAGQNRIEGSFFFDQEGAIQVNPSQNMNGILIFGEISFGIVPSPPLEDLIYDAQKYPSASHIYLPSETLFLGLLKGEDRIFFCAWPDDNQRVKLILEDGEKGLSTTVRRSRRSSQAGEKLIEAVEIQLAGKSVYLKSISAPGIWHKQELLPTYLGKDVALDWKKPFPAKWKTQLLEGEIETTFPFVTQKDRIWRPNFGFYEYPVCFEGEKAFFRLGKKVPPSGQALIYALEEYRNAPVDFARARLGSISTLKPKTGLRRYPLDNVGIQNCDGRAWVKWIFKVDYQIREEEFLQEVMADFLYSINVDKGRLEEYEKFIPKIKEKIDSWIEKEKDNPELELFLSQMKEKVEELEREYWDKMDKLPASEHLQEETEAINQLKALIEGYPPVYGGVGGGLEFYPEACYLLDKIQLWSLIESVPGRVGGLLRELSQQAGYACAHNADVVKYAEEIRRDIREFIITGETHETIY